jgi:hypothetical protein
MEKLFSWKVLVSFCAVFIVTWVLLQAVSSLRLEDEAKLIGESIFCWQWPGENWQSKAEMTGAAIISKTNNDAVIKVNGKQKISAYAGEYTHSESGIKDDENEQNTAAKPLDNSSIRSETVDCSAVLTLYRRSGKWVLGRVEL